MTKAISISYYTGCHTNRKLYLARSTNKALSDNGSRRCYIREGVEVSYAITVEFILMPGAMAAFRALIDENAQSSMDNEPGCQRFDVLLPDGNADTIFLYEIYDNKQAFDAHLKTAHFQVFNQQSAPLVKSRSITAYELAFEATRQGAN